MSFDARTIIAQVRGGDTPSAAALSWFANGLADGQISDAQAGAFAMAVCLNGLGAEGRVHLTCAMRDSGDCLQWDFDGPVLENIPPAEWAIVYRLFWRHFWRPQGFTCR